MSVGRDRKIDIYSVSMKEETEHEGLFDSCISEITFPLFPPIPPPLHHIVSHLHLFTLSFPAELLPEQIGSSRHIPAVLNLIIKPDNRGGNSVHVLFISCSGK